MEIKFTNTLTRQKEVFHPIESGKVGIYSCGPTVYATPHIGNFRAFIFADLLRRSLEFLGLEVKQVMNITDVGHLTSDSDAGEDKLEKGAKREGISPLEVARKYEDEFRRNITKLNIETPNELPRASEHIEEQIALIKKLEEKGFTYETSDGIYFDTSKFADYGKLGGQKLDEKEAGARIEVKSEKRNPADFALWKFCVGENKDHILRWTNPSGAGEGFPGWHLECSAMSSKYLGESFDIHTGGIDHVPVHHENEIAQSECAHGKKFVNYWLHNEFLTVDGGKMSKSLGNLFTVQDLELRNFDPLAFRYLCLNSHYRSKLNFTWEALKNAQNSLKNLRDIYQALPENKKGEIAKEAEFEAAIADDLNSPKALAVAWEIARDENLAPEVKKATLDRFDEVLALDLGKAEAEVELTNEQQELLVERKKAREEKNWSRSDEIRDQFAAENLEIEDTKDGEQIVKRNLK